MTESFALPAPAGCPALIVAVLLLATGAWPTAALAQEEAAGQIYADNCAHCHGLEGDGQGYAFDVTFPRPRDFTYGMYKFRKTASGEYPTLDDLTEIISAGMPGTSMPAWNAVLDPGEIRMAAEHVQRFYAEADDDPVEALTVPQPLPETPQRIARGRELFQELECAQCHGERGRGDGYNAMTLTEDWNEGPIYPRNLTAGWLFRGGHEPGDIYRTIMFGVNGTPMPSHIDEEVLAHEEARWALVHYVRSLGTHDEPEGKSTLISHLVDGELPLEGDAPLWEEARAMYVPLAGQVILQPRLFQPSVRYLWVRSLYNAEEIAFRVRWVDPTSADNKALVEGLSKVAEEEGVDPATLPIPVDELAIQFPLRFEPGRPLPHFLMGSPGKPVRLWVWRSDREGMAAVKTSTLGSLDQGQGQSRALQAAVDYRDGQYTLTVKRKRLIGGAGQVAFAAEPGVIPISFSVVDGFKGEGGARRAVATWYNLLLEKQVGPEIYYVPLVLALAILGLEWRLVLRTRRSAKD